MTSQEKVKLMRRMMQLPASVIANALVEHGSVELGRALVRRNQARLVEREIRKFEAWKKGGLTNE